MRSSFLLRYAALCVPFLAVCGCDQPVAQKTAPTVGSAPTKATMPVLAPSTAKGPIDFEEVARSAGVDFVQVSGMTPDRHYPSANGSGVAIFDYNGDGKMDIYLASCNVLPLEKTPKASNKLYKNLGNGKFEDVTDASGLGFRGFCHGIVVGDVDNDGDQDVFLCNLGGNVLYLNRSDGTYQDVSAAAGIDTPNWSSGGAFLDYDNDGDLDLYIAVYGLWDLKTDGERWCGNDSADGKSKIRQYCSPATVRHDDPHVLSQRWTQKRRSALHQPDKRSWPFA